MSLKSKTCPSCKIERKSIEFSKDKHSKDGLQANCKACKKIYKQKYSKQPKIIPETKVCSSCKIEKKNTEFSKSKQSKAGLTYQCKSCMKICCQKYSEKPKSIPETKICGSCEIEKQNTEFSKDKYSKDGLFSHCKACKKIYDIKRSKQPKTVPETKICLSCKIEKKNTEFSKFKYSNDGLKFQCKACQKIYQQNNRQQINKARRKTRKNNYYIKLYTNISRSINRCLKSNSIKKYGAFRYLPYTIEELKAHIEAKFKLPGNEWMTWNKWGVYNPAEWNDNDKSTWTWQLDHIIPLSILPCDSVDHPNFKKAWALENLRPYPAKQNIIDGNRRVNKKHEAHSSTT